MFNPILACEWCGLTHQIVMLSGGIIACLWACWSDIRRYWGI